MGGVSFDLTIVLIIYVLLLDLNISDFKMFNKMFSNFCLTKNKKNFIIKA